MILYIQLANQFTYTVIDRTQLKIYKPFKFELIVLDWREIKGYSLSKFYYGRNLYSSKSFVIYPTSKSQVEIINLFSLNYNHVLLSLQKNKIIKLGHEPYHTGIWKRKYKFQE